MTVDDRSTITSEDYADFIIDYRYNPQLLKGFQNAFVHIMNETYAVVHIPLSSLPDNIIQKYGYLAIPKIFGLTSDISLEASGVFRLRNVPNFNLTGSGVLIGIIDTGIDYLNPVFRKEDNQTKIVSIWDQNIDSTNAYPFNTLFGTQYTSEQINQALVSDNPLSIVPSTDEIGHGTMMAAVASGTRNQEAEFQGVAPSSELVVVKLRQAKNYLRQFYFIPETAIAYQENDIMWGVQYCIQVARQLKRPIAICLGIGSSQSSHTGSSNLSSYLSIVSDFTNVGIVTSVGNEGNLGRHFYSTINPKAGSVAVELNVGESENSFSMELWGDFPGLYSIDILSPAGEFIPRISSGLRVSREVSFIFEKTTIFIDYQITGTASGNQLILLRFRDPSPGTWRINVYIQGNLPTGFHIWLPMGNFITTDTYFLNPDIYTTVLEPGTAYTPLAMTAYNPLNGSLFVYASRGYSNDNLVKPELAAPGVNYVAPALNNQFTTYSGTGVAAAHTAGVVALFLEWAVIRGNYLNVDTIVIKNFFIKGAAKRENQLYPNRDWGYGTLDIYSVFNILRGTF